MRPSLPALTSTRYFAALAVVLFHYNLNGAQFLPYWLCDFGREAVTFFFVLSGFILTYVHGTAADGINITSRRFYISRLARIFPAYGLGLLVAIPFPIYSVWIGAISPLTFSTEILLCLLLLQAWVPAAALIWNTPAWSLSVEVFLYSIFPGLLWLVRHTTAQRFLMISSFAVVLVAVWNHLNEGRSSSEQWHNFLRYWPVFHLPQFVFGVALGRLFIAEKRISKYWFRTLLIAGVALVAAIVALKPSAPWLTSNIFLAPAFGMIIFGGAGASGVLSDFLSLRPLVFLGDASYAMYILHIPLWQWWHWATRKHFHTQLVPVTDLILYLIIVTAVSVTVMICFERPLRKLIIRSLAGR